MCRGAIITQGVRGCTWHRCTVLMSLALLSRRPHLLHNRVAFSHIVSIRQVSAHILPYTLSASKTLYPVERPISSPYVVVVYRHTIETHVDAGEARDACIVWISVGIGPDWEPQRCRLSPAIPRLTWGMVEPESLAIVGDMVRMPGEALLGNSYATPDVRAFSMPLPCTVQRLMPTRVRREQERTHVSQGLATICPSTRQLVTQAHLLRRTKRGEGLALSRIAPCDDSWHRCCSA